MKILVSTKLLAKTLSKIYLTDAGFVTNVIPDGKELIINSRKTQVKIPVEFIGESKALDQQSVRWDWIYDNLVSVDDQSVILNINENMVEVIYQY